MIKVFSFLVGHYCEREYSLLCALHYFLSPEPDIRMVDICRPDIGFSTEALVLFCISYYVLPGLGITIAGYTCEREELSGIFVKSVTQGSAAHRLVGVVTKKMHLTIGRLRRPFPSARNNS